MASGEITIGFRRNAWFASRRWPPASALPAIVCFAGSFAVQEAGLFSSGAFSDFAKHFRVRRRREIYAGRPVSPTLFARKDLAYPPLLANHWKRSCCPVENPVEKQIGNAPILPRKIFAGEEPSFFRRFDAFLQHR